MEIPRITPDEVREAVGRGDAVAFLDARSERARQASGESLPGALRVRAEALDGVAGRIPRRATLVAYCAAGDEDASARVALRLRELGFEDAYALAGGFAAWKEAGFPLVPLVHGDPAENAAHHQPM